MISWTRRALAEHGSQLATFVVVGALTAAIYLGVFEFLHGAFNTDYRVAASAAYVVGVGFHFFANRTYSFGAKVGALSIQIARYWVVVGVNYVAMLGTVTLIVAGFGLSPRIGMVMGIATTILTSYFLLKLWVFRTPSGSE